MAEFSSGRKCRGVESDSRRGKVQRIKGSSRRRPFNRVKDAPFSGFSEGKGRSTFVRLLDGLLAASSSLRAEDAAGEPRVRSDFRVFPSFFHTERVEDT